MTVLQQNYSKHSHVSYAHRDDYKHDMVSFWVHLKNTLECIFDWLFTFELSGKQFYINGLNILI